MAVGLLPTKESSRSGTAGSSDRDHRPGEPPRERKQCKQEPRLVGAKTCQRPPLAIPDRSRLFRNYVAGAARPGTGKTPEPAQAEAQPAGSATCVAARPAFCRWAPPGLDLQPQLRASGRCVARSSCWARQVGGMDPFVGWYVKLDEEGDQRTGRGSWTAKSSR
jgi:hypothetical protein